MDLFRDSDHIFKGYCEARGSLPVMKVVALISGGKDSTFNMMECVRLGHEIVALANLYPEATDGSAAADELDSYCFQTVGHTVIQAYADCMGGLPLHRRAIKLGASKNLDMVYEETAGDEVEDLFALLQEVKRKQPEVEAVSSGAVLSDYQRLRVEHVCDRLGLTSLAFMWRRPQQQLLRTMIGRDVDAIIVKIAAMGLCGKQLGKTIAELEPMFCRLEDQYGCHAAGEGGEYESLTLDCPLFTHRLVIDETDTVNVSTDKFAPVAFLHVKTFHLEKKEAAPLAKPEPEAAVAPEAEYGAASAAGQLLETWRGRAEEWCVAAATATGDIPLHYTEVLQSTGSSHDEPEPEQASESDAARQGRLAKLSAKAVSGLSAGDESRAASAHAFSAAPWGTELDVATASVMSGESFFHQTSKTQSSGFVVHTCSIPPFKKLLVLLAVWVLVGCQASPPSWRRLDSIGKMSTPPASTWATLLISSLSIEYTAGLCARPLAVRALFVYNTAILCDANLSRLQLFRWGSTFARVCGHRCKPAESRDDGVPGKVRSPFQQANPSKNSFEPLRFYLYTGQLHHRECPGFVCVKCRGSAAPRRVLHVRSVSLWAPACIGPYSQASTISGLLHCAGQIPLLPAGMALVQPREPVWAEALRCVESCRRCLEVHRSSLSLVLGVSHFIFCVVCANPINS